MHCVIPSEGSHVGRTIGYLFIFLSRDFVGLVVLVADLRFVCVLLTVGVVNHGWCDLFIAAFSASYSYMRIVCVRAVIQEHSSEVCSALIITCI